MAKFTVDPDRKLLENVSAISAQFHMDKKYQKFYDKHADDLGGFVGIWNIMVDAGLQFTKAEKELKLVAGDDFDWIQAIDTFAGSLIRFPEYFYDRELNRIAKQAIEGAKYGK